MTYIVSTLRKLVHPSPEPSPRAMGITSSLAAESSSLPVELLLIIFQYAAEEHHKMESPDYDINAKIDYLAPILEEQQDLSSFTQVCQSWYYAGLPILYRIPYLHSVHHIHLLARSLRESQLYEGYVQGLFLGYIPRKTGTIHSWFGRSPVFKQLKSRIDASSLEEDLKFVLTTCPHIDKLSLYHIKYPSSNPSDDYSEYVPIYDMMHWNEEQDSPHPSPTLPVIEKLQSLSICGKFSDGGELNFYPYDTFIFLIQVNSQLFQLYKHSE
ncbi:hypothetical protein C8Q75DRAFT_729941 [Abortiporus biennis]|nr:hypothetical protein C8Q75DRAFT_729941 [Abortiporus biennis]